VPVALNKSRLPLAWLVGDTFTLYMYKENPLTTIANSSTLSLYLLCLVWLVNAVVSIVRTERYFANDSAVALMNETERLDQFRGMVSCVWSYSVLITTVLSRLSTGHQLRVHLTDDAAGTDVFAADMREDGSIDAVPLNQYLDPSTILSEAAYSCTLGVGPSTDTVAYTYIYTHTRI
jgi:hypothetical protein